MATVDINSSWSYSKSNSVVSVTANTSAVNFQISDDYNGYLERAKAYIPIYNISQYESITLNYSSFVGSGMYTFQFGVFDDSSASSTSGQVASHEFSSSGGTVTISGLSGMSGTKYVGFWFQGNSYSPGVNTYGYPYVSISISSLTAAPTNYTLTYDANGGFGAIESQTASGGSTVTLQSNSFTAPTSKIWTLTLSGNGGHDGTPTFKSNYFANWREGSPSGAVYSEGDSYVLNKDTTMYAGWGTKYIWGTTTRDSVINEGYTVSFDANEGICNTSSLTSTIITSYEFLGWGNSESDPTTIFVSDAEYGQVNDYTAYAVWSEPITTNGSINLPTPTRDGYDFLGWSLDEYDTSGIIGEYTPNEDGIVLYAIWGHAGNVYIYDSTGEFSQYQALIYDGSDWNQYVPYIYTESGWEIYSG